MKVAVVGGGINGLCAAWELACSGHDVSLFEKGKLLGATSSSSSKLLHGGIRYLENFEFRLVREALKERAWWLKHVPQHTSRLNLCLPVYEGGRRSAWKVRLGLIMYDWLAGHNNIGRYECVPANKLNEYFPCLDKRGLKCVFTFFDGQMDEVGLGAWVVTQAKSSGVRCFERTEVLSIKEDGFITLEGECRQFDRVINMAGPWSSELNEKSGLQSSYELDLVRGSHIVLNLKVDCGYLLEVFGERRVFFVLPYQGKTLVGTTEVRQGLNEDIVCSKEEKRYLISAYNHYFIDKIGECDVVDSFAGVRPLIKSANDPGKVTREYAIERRGRVISVFGGKWTTAKALAIKIVKEVERDGFY